MIINQKRINTRTRSSTARHPEPGHPWAPAVALLLALLARAALEANCESALLAMQKASHKSSRAWWGLPILSSSLSDRPQMPPAPTARSNHCKRAPPNPESRPPLRLPIDPQLLRGGYNHRGAYPLGDLCRAATIPATGCCRHPIRLLPFALVVVATYVQMSPGAKRPLARGGWWPGGGSYT